MKKNSKTKKGRKKKLIHAEISSMSMTEIREYYNLENIQSAPPLKRRGAIDHLTEMGKQPKNSKRINKKFLENRKLIQNKSL